MESSNEIEKARKIARLNDELRRTFTTGRVVMTVGFEALEGTTWIKAIKAVRDFSAFTLGNDPYGEHDFGLLEVDGIPLIWKIDYYDLTLTSHSPDPADPDLTLRVLTMMRVEEY